MTNTDISNNEAGRVSIWVSLSVLTIFTLMTFFNSWPDVLIFDDQAFVGPYSEHRLEHLADGFSEDLWGRGGGLYRPLLRIDFEIQTRLFGSWRQGYHLVNIFLHLITTLTLFGFLRFFLRTAEKRGKHTDFFALIAALVFAAHPVHTEVVNSVFNKSSMYVSLAAICGLWWLLQHLPKSPARAWLGFGLIYSVAILFKESALVLPGIAVGLIVLYTDGSLKDRIRRFLPVFWLLIPIALYFWLRALAIATTAAGSDGVAEDVAIETIFKETRLVGSTYLAQSIAMFGQGMKILAWPYPLHLVYHTPTDTQTILYIGLQFLVGFWAIYLLVKGRPVLAFSLFFYYLTLLPSTRLISMDGAAPHIMERYLYLPSVGIAIALAVGIQSISSRLPRKHLLLIMLPVILALAMISWDRNSDWKSGVGLFETEYQLGSRDTFTLRLLIASHYLQGRDDRMATICDENKHRFETYYKMVNACVVSYITLKRTRDAMEALEAHAREGDDWLKARLSLASLYKATRQYQKVVGQYADIIDRIDDPAVKDFYKAEMLLAVYPDDREQLQLARALLIQALAAKPDLEEAREGIEILDSMLADMDAKPEADDGN